MDCFLNVVKALGIASCLSLDDWEDLPMATATSGLIASRKRKKQTGEGKNWGVDTLLQRIPGRMFLNGSSDCASLFSKQGTKGVKQDAILVWENFGISEDTIFCGVFDGHGPYGHLVAKNVRDSLPVKLRALWELIRSRKDGPSDIGGNAVGNLNSEDSALSHLDKEPNDLNHQIEESEDDILLKLTESFLKAFKVVDKELKHHPSVNCFCSGTTAVTLLKEGQYLIIGNVGDSRAVLGTRGKGNSLKAVQLTVDMKPNLPEEAERIRRCKGRVFALPNEPNVARIWPPNSDTPGLAMARSLGDFCLKKYGLISVPEISYRHITDQDEFVVLASDGVWDVLTNIQVVDIVSSVPRSNAARYVVETAVRTWKSRHPAEKIDDCAVVCLFLNSRLNYKSSFSISQ